MRSPLAAVRLRALCYGRPTLHIVEGEERGNWWRQKQIVMRALVAATESDGVPTMQRRWNGACQKAQPLSEGGRALLSEGTQTAGAALPDGQLRLIVDTGCAENILPRHEARVHGGGMDRSHGCRTKV